MSTDIVNVEPVLPMHPDQAQAAMTQYQELARKVLASEDWQGTPGKHGSFVKRRGFMKFATFYGVSTEILRDTIERDENGQVLRARVIARAIHPNGRHADGDGACSISERRFQSASGRQKIEHDLPATAATRATNRAISNLIGFGQVSAEEVDGDAPAEPSLPYGPEGDAESDQAVMAIIDRLYPDVPGAQFVALVNHQLGPQHLPQASSRMVHAIEWALGDERMRRPPENAPPEPEQSAYHTEQTP